MCNGFILLILPPSMVSILLRSFKQKIKKRKKILRLFLSRIEKNPPKKLDVLVEKLEKEVWAEIDCLSCANCCKSMSPTFTQKDMIRIAKHLELTVAEFKTKWLRKERGTGDWINKKMPCQFLALKSNKCNIYEVRPRDCSGFPHLPKKKMVEYLHVHKQNVEFCPATANMVEKMKVLFEAK